MNAIERAMRLMTQLNIGATIATAAWVLWSGSQVVAGTGQWPGAAATPRPGLSHMPTAATPQAARPATPPGPPAAARRGNGWQDT